MRLQKKEVADYFKMKGEAYALDQMPARTLNKRQSKLAKKGDGTS
jgi:hypothetical protein